jgi:hypothetical protein
MATYAGRMHASSLYMLLLHIIYLCVLLHPPASSSARGDDDGNNKIKPNYSTISICVASHSYVLLLYCWGYIIIRSISLSGLYLLSSSLDRSGVTTVHHLAAVCARIRPDRVEYNPANPSRAGWLNLINSHNKHC